MAEQDIASEENDNEGYGWIEEFINRDGNDYLLPVPIDFICDKFNLVGLSKFVEEPDLAAKFLLGNSVVIEESEVIKFYLLVHQRYILSKIGLEEVFLRVINEVYGTCKVFGCNSAPLIPMGLTDLPDLSTVKLYCHNCRNIFEPDCDNNRLDACAFGRTFPHFLEMSYKNNFNKNKIGKYVPRIFGFKIFEEGNK